LSVAGGSDRPPSEPAARVRVGAVELSNAGPLAIIGGLNVLEDPGIVNEVASAFVEETRAVGLPFIFKASFDKANRSAPESPRGPGLAGGLRVLAEVRARFRVPVLTDVHEAGQCRPVAEVADALQIPAFLSRQTDLLLAASATGRPLHVKKMQMAAPWDLAHVVRKCLQGGNDQILLCERGTFFGYGNLVVDPLAFPELKKIGCPVTFDVTHALQLPGARGSAAGGRAEHTASLALAGVSQGIAGLFLEVHPEPSRALCDGPSALPLAQLSTLLRKIKLLDNLVKGALSS
jgi:2-dehydro-3-deoxyphosphooctonate aldolase (KDO 8-P synthase)